MLCVLSYIAMEKHTSAPRDVEQTVPSQLPIAAPTRASRATTKRLAIVVLVAVFLHVGYFFQGPLSRLIHRASCHKLLGHLTVEQRAHKILKENPLIGQPQSSIVNRNRN